MIVVRVEIWPGGNRDRRRHLGTAAITNNACGTETRGSYVARFFVAGKRKKTWHVTNVNGFPRTRLLAWDLLFRALRNVCGKRNP